MRFVYVFCCAVMALLSFDLDALALDFIPDASALSLGQMKLTPRVKLVEHRRDAIATIDLELRRSVDNGGSLYIADPFFTCQWPIYSLMFIFNQEGQCLASLEMPKLANWQGETQGRPIHSGEICGRRLQLSYFDRNATDHAKDTCPERIRMQLALLDGIAIGPDHIDSVDRVVEMRKLKGSIVARSEVVDLGEVPANVNFFLMDSGYSEPVADVKQSFEVRLEGPESCALQSSSTYVDVVFFNNSSSMTPLFDPGQEHYGSERSPLKREIVLIPSNQRITYSSDGIGLSGSNNALRPWDGIVQLPPHTFFGRSQPWLHSSQAGRFRLNLSVYNWILCPQKNGLFVRGDALSSSVITSASFEYVVK